MDRSSLQQSSTSQNFVEQNLLNSMMLNDSSLCARSPNDISNSIQEQKQGLYSQSHQEQSSILNEMSLDAQTFQKHPELLLVLATQYQRISDDDPIRNQFKKFFQISESPDDQIKIQIQQKAQQSESKENNKKQPTEQFQENKQQKQENKQEKQQNQIEEQNKQQNEKQHKQNQEKIQSVSEIQQHINKIKDYQKQSSQIKDSQKNIQEKLKTIKNIKSQNQKKLMDIRRQIQLSKLQNKLYSKFISQNVLGEQAKITLDDKSRDALQCTIFISEAEIDQSNQIDEIYEIAEKEQQNNQQEQNYIDKGFNQYNQQDATIYILQLRQELRNILLEQQVFRKLILSQQLNIKKIQKKIQENKIYIQKSTQIKQFSMKDKNNEGKTLDLQKNVIYKLVSEEIDKIFDPLNSLGSQYHSDPKIYIDKIVQLENEVQKLKDSIEYNKGVRQCKINRIILAENKLQNLKKRHQQVQSIEKQNVEKKNQINEPGSQEARNLVRKDYQNNLSQRNLMREMTNEEYLLHTYSQSKQNSSRKASRQHQQVQNARIFGTHEQNAAVERNNRNPSSAQRHSNQVPPLIRVQKCPESTNNNKKKMCWIRWVFNFLIVFIVLAICNKLIIVENKSILQLLSNKLSQYRVQKQVLQKQEPVQIVYHQKKEQEADLNVKLLNQSQENVIISKRQDSQQIQILPGDIKQMLKQTGQLEQHKIDWGRILKEQYR